VENVRFGASLLIASGRSGPVHAVPCGWQAFIHSVAAVSQWRTITVAADWVSILVMSRAAAAGWRRHGAARLVLGGMQWSSGVERRLMQQHDPSMSSSDGLLAYRHPATGEWYTWQPLSWTWPSWIYTVYSRLTTHRTFRPQDVYNLAYSDKTQAPSFGCFNYSCHSVRMSFWIKRLLSYLFTSAKRLGGVTSRGRTELTKGRNIHKSLSHGRPESLHGIVHVTTGYVLASRHRYKWRECNCHACYVIVVWRHTDDWVVTSRMMTSVSRGCDRQLRCIVDTSLLSR